MKSSFSKKPESRVQSSREKRRKKIKRQKRNEQVLHLWRTFFFTTLTGLLGWIFINNGWALISKEDIKIHGSKKIDPESIIKASEFFLPKPLLSINPRSLEKKLLENLPISKVTIRRTLVPPRLEINLLERQPIAYAFRKYSNRKEEGMLDKDGEWMPLSMANQLKPTSIELHVEGWIESQKDRVSTILDNRNNLGSPLEKIILSPTGALTLKTQELGVIHLGSNRSFLEKQLKIIPHLSKTLPKTFRNKYENTIDIRDPSKPEVQLPDPKS